MVAAILLSYWVISNEAVPSGFGYKYLHKVRSPLTSSTVAAEPAASSTGAGIWTTIFAYYCLFIHVLVSMFPIRSCWSIWDLTRSLKKIARSKALKDIKMSHRRRGSSTSLSSSETLTSSRDGSAFSSSASSEAGDADLEPFNDGDAEPDSVIHAIVIPNYKEEVDTLRETLEVLASHPQARCAYDVSRWVLWTIALSIRRFGARKRLPGPLNHLANATFLRRSTLVWSSANTTLSSRP